jgi:hypothetical protein
MSPIIVYRQLLINSMRKCVYLLDGAPHLERINRLRHLGEECAMESRCSRKALNKLIRRSVSSNSDDCRFRWSSPVQAEIEARVSRVG